MSGSGVIYSDFAADAGSTSNQEEARLSKFLPGTIMATSNLPKAILFDIGGVCVCTQVSANVVDLQALTCGK